MYPRHLLTSHFWTLQQRNEFAIIKMKSRLEYNLGVLRYLQAKLSECKQTDELYDKWKHILGQLGSGTHPTSTEILAAKDVFARPPYNTRSLGSTHVVIDRRFIFSIYMRIYINFMCSRNIFAV